ncbi:glycosyltransferase family 2 protein [Carboxylicivirga marina]|uniref:Glycosyltransferase family 2 protein n=1 Tax=Carboxylicivirga marina TaxID=2800988 RepID=A0ABS1HJ35_9BACT|nr:glycosyltransferase family 2 protein [Carboxylicivirga marina]MBK3517679.1 glycosyltransferase family 2 protein [Carboxylicivirga marina]
MVSIVIPTYNQEQYIAYTLESVLKQSYNDIEVIISDDCSNDNTVKIIQTYAAKDDRIKLLTASINNGISINFNKAFDACTGKYVAFLGGDDLMHPDKILKQVSFLENNPDYALCMHDMIMFNEKEGVRFKHSDKYYASTNPLDWCLYTNWFFNKRTIGILPSSCLARADYYLSSRYDSRLKYKHELLFHLGIYCNQPKAKWHFINEILGTYRIHNTNFSSSSENISMIPEDSNVYYAIASYKHPQLTRKIKNAKKYFWFRQLLFDWLPQQNRKQYKHQFRLEAGIFLYFYLLVCKALLRTNLLFKITKPLRLLSFYNNTTK